MTRHVPTLTTGTRSTWTTQDRLRRFVRMRRTLCKQTLELGREIVRILITIISNICSFIFIILYIGLYFIILTIYMSWCLSMYCPDWCICTGTALGLRLAEDDASTPKHTGSFKSFLQIVILLYAFVGKCDWLELRIFESKCY